MKIRMALETPDGLWRVEVVQEGARLGYRLLHDGEVQHQRIGIGEVEFYLRREGIDMAELVEVPVDEAHPPVRRRTGATTPSRPSH